MDETAALKTLKGARKLLAKKDVWVKGRYVKFNEAVPGGKQFCSIGAIEEVDGPGENLAKKLLAKAILFISGKKSSGGVDPATVVVRFNDRKETEKKDVLTAFDKAIELAQNGGLK